MRVKRIKNYKRKKGCDYKEEKSKKRCRNARNMIKRAHADYEFPDVSNSVLQLNMQLDKNNLSILAHATFLWHLAVQKINQTCLL